MRKLTAAALLASAALLGQDTPRPQLVKREQPAAKEVTSRVDNGAGRDYVIPAGTSVPVSLEQAVTTKSARPGDKIYCKTVFPVAIDNRIVIPAGTYVQGEVTEAKRPGRVKGRGELLLHFTTMIMPNGYMFTLPGAVENSPDSDASKVKDKEGTIQSEGTKLKDLGTVATTAAAGTAVGAMTTGTRKGALAGGAMGAAAGTAIALLTRGADLRLERGATLTMVFQRPITMESSKLMEPVH